MALSPLRFSGEPGGNRTFNPQIKRSRGECPPSIAGSFSLGKPSIWCSLRLANSARVRPFGCQIGCQTTDIQTLDLQSSCLHEPIVRYASVFLETVLSYAAGLSDETLLGGVVSIEPLWPVKANSRRNQWRGRYSRT